MAESDNRTNLYMTKEWLFANVNLLFVTRKPILFLLPKE